MPRTVLLADDSVTAQNMGRRILMDAGYEVITVNNGSAALKKIHENQPDLIVLDVYMPGYGGLEVCQRLKESGQTMRIPVLLTVGKMEPFKSEEARRVRADGHIVKPFDASELLAALTKLEDRIVPQAVWPSEQKAKAEKKGRLWHIADSAKQPPAEWNEKIAHLAEVKQRQMQAEQAEPAASETADERSATAATPIEEPGQGAQQQAKEIPPSPPAVEATAPEFEVPESSPAENQPEEQLTAPPEEPELAETVPAPAAEARKAPQGARTEAPSATAVAESPAAVAAPAVEAKSEPSTPIAALPSRWIAENIPLSAEEASLELEQEMLQAQAAMLREAQLSAERKKGPEAARHQIPPPESQQENAPEPVHSNPHFGAVFAAAASAEASAVTLPVTTQGEEPAPVFTAETRAAWENWQRIRDSVMSPQSTTAVVEAASEAASEAARETASRQVSGDSEPSAAASVLESAVLASIVDSVLAELKPRLMEEIAKKLKK